MTPRTLSAVFFFFVFLVWQSLRPRREAPGRLLYFLRAFFPNWRFFEDLGELPQLEFRVNLGQPDWGPWTPVFSKLTIRPWQVILNPEGNWRYAQNSLLQQAVSELEMLGESAESTQREFSRSTSYRLIQRLVEQHIRRTHTANLGLQYEFRLQVQDVSQAHGLTQDLLLSATHRLAPQPSQGRL
ncbi:MAG: hypothetical protein ACO3A2_08135 [Bdellovibrionia bacterium]